jgi:ribonuclease HII
MSKFKAGIDEAGRGPLIGPLVIAVAAIKEEGEETLRDMGVKDSKLLSPKQREEIFKMLEKSIRYEIVIVPPEEIDAAVNSQTYNLNWLEADKGAEILNKLDIKLDNDIDKVIIDCPSNNPEAYKKYFKSKVDNKDIELVVEHKADLNHLVVGAASILAKVTRDKEIEKIKKKIKIDFGSGYPSDPKTKEFVKNYHSNPKMQHLFRKSWDTYKRACSSGKQSKLDGF